jgi:thymidylate synthase (FAD)
MTEDSAKEFVDRMIKSGHGAMLEHGTVYLKFEIVKSARHPLDKYYHNKYSIVTTEEGLTKETKIVFVTTNLRVLVEKNWLDDLKYICEPTEHHERRYTVKFICDRGVSHEFVRHRVFSFAQESTRYCNYSKDKFGNELTFILPCWLTSNIIDLGNDHKALQNNTSEEHLWYLAMEYLESTYLKMKNWKAQEARAILPNSLKTELVMTGFVNDWKHFFELRTAGSAHPQARELAIPLKEEFINRKYI